MLNPVTRSRELTPQEAVGAGSLTEVQAVKPTQNSDQADWHVNDLPEGKFNTPLRKTTKSGH